MAENVRPLANGRMTLPALEDALKPEVWFASPSKEAWEDRTEVVTKVDHALYLETAGEVVAGIIEAVAAASPDDGQCSAAAPLGAAVEGDGGVTETVIGTHASFFFFAMLCRHWVGRSRRLARADLSTNGRVG